MNYEESILVPLKRETAIEISNWAYEKPYDVYSFYGTPNGYLMKSETWGDEQFCLIYNNTVVGQLACQFDNGDMWVGWSLNPTLCGKNDGFLFINKYIKELRRIKKYNSNIYLSVAAWNKRAIKCYEKSGFNYVKTIIDEIAYTDKQEDFWIMKECNHT